MNLNDSETQLLDRTIESLRLIQQVNDERKLDWSGSTFQQLKRPDATVMVDLKRVEQMLQKNGEVTPSISNFLADPNPSQVKNVLKNLEEIRDRT